MSNFSADDVHRSLNRYVAAALGDAWDVRTEREVIADSQRPAAVVEPSSALGRLSGAKPDRRTIPQGDVSRMQSFAVQAYPAIFDTAREGRQEAQRVAQLLDDAITLGLVSDEGSPRWVPVWDDDFTAPRSYVNGFTGQAFAPTLSGGRMLIEAGDSSHFMTPQGSYVGLDPNPGVDLHVLDVGPDFRATMSFAKSAGSDDFYVGFQGRDPNAPITNGTVYPDCYLRPEQVAAQCWCWTAADGWVLLADLGAGAPIDAYDGPVWVQVGQLDRKQWAAMYLSDPSLPGEPVMVATATVPQMSAMRALFADWYAYSGGSLLVDRYTIEVPGRPPTAVGHPLAVPVYDYDDVPVVGARRAGPVEPYGWAMVEDHSVQTVQDPIDAKRWTVAQSIRLSWWRGGRIGPAAPVVTRMPGTFHP